MSTIDTSTKLPRGYWALFAPSALVGLADTVRTVTLVWMFVNDVKNASLLSILLIANAIARISTPILFAATIASGHRLRLLTLCMLASVFANGAILLVCIHGDLQLLYLLPVLEFITAASGTIFLVSRQSLLRIILTDEQKSFAVSYLRVNSYTLKILGPALAGALLAIASVNQVIFLCTGISLWALIIVSRFKCIPNTEIFDNKVSGSVSLAQSILFYKENPRIRDGLLYYIFSNLALSPIAIIIPLFISDIFARGPFELGLSEAALGVGAVVGALLSPRLCLSKLGTGYVVLVGLFTLIFICGQFGTRSFQFFLLALIGIGLCVGFFGSKIDALFMREVPVPIYARIVGIQSLIAGSGYPIGLLMCSLIIQIKQGYVYLPLFSALVCIVGVGLATRFSDRVLEETGL